MIKAYVIGIDEYQRSMEGVNKAIESFKASGNTIPIEHFSAITPETSEEVIQARGWSRETKPFFTHKGGTHRPTKNACTLSHALVWEKAVESGEPVLVVEHDSVFNRKIDFEMLLSTDHWFIGINNGNEGAWHRAIKERSEDFIVTLVRPEQPDHISGLQGGSAYIVKPEGAKAVLDFISEWGILNNDGAICINKFPGKLAITKEGLVDMETFGSTSSDGW